MAPFMPGKSSASSLSGNARSHTYGASFPAPKPVARDGQVDAHCWQFTARQLVAIGPDQASLIASLTRS